MDDLGVPPFQETSIKASTWSFLVVSRRSNQPGTCFENGSGLHGLEKHPVTSMMLQFETPFIICYWLVVFRHPSEKSWSSSVGMIIPNMMGKIKNVPNHQAVILVILVLKAIWFMTVLAFQSVHVYWVFLKTIAPHNWNACAWLNCCSGSLIFVPNDQPKHNLFKFMTIHGVVVLL